MGFVEQVSEVKHCCSQVIKLVEGLSLSEQVRKRLLVVVESKYFNQFCLLLIVFNTCLMAIVFDGMPEAMRETLDTMNIVLTAAFAMEAVLKITALGISKFMSDSFNLFDLFIVATSLVELSMSGQSAVSAVRCAPQ